MKEMRWSCLMRRKLGLYVVIRAFLCVMGLVRSYVVLFT